MPVSAKILVLLMACAMGGCASDSGVVANGPGKYKVTRHAISGFGRSDKLMAATVAEAEAYCTKQQQRTVITWSGEAPPPFFFGNFPKAEVQFYCLNSDTQRN